MVNIKKIDPLTVDFTIPEKNMKLLKTSMAKGGLQIVVTVENFNVTADTISKKYYGTLQVLDNALIQQLEQSPSEELFPIKIESYGRVSS